jgi:hypothetical protein
MSEKTEGKIRLFPYRQRRSIGVSCEVRTSSAYKQVKLFLNRTWRPAGVFPVRYEHHLHIKK